MSSTRLADFPGVPTFTELGYELKMEAWYGLFGPRGVPDDRVRRLESAVRNGLEKPETRHGVKKLKAQVNYLDSVKFSEFLTNETKTIRAVVQRLGKLPLAR